MYLCAYLLLQELSGQQQTSSSESEFDFARDDGASTASEFGEEGVDVGLDPSGSSGDAAAGPNHVSGKQSLFEAYKDPSKQFSGQTRSYHKDARYKKSLQFTLNSRFLLLTLWKIKVISSALCGTGISLDTVISATTVWPDRCGDMCSVDIQSLSSGATIRTHPRSGAWQLKTSRKHDRARGLSSNHTNRW